MTKKDIKNLKVIPRFTKEKTRHELQEFYKYELLRIKNNQKEDNNEK